MGSGGMQTISIPTYFYVILKFISKREGRSPVKSHSMGYWKKKTKIVSVSPNIEQLLRIKVRNIFYCFVRNITNLNRYNLYPRLLFGLR